MEQQLEATQTALQTEISKKTTAAVSDTGFGPEFDAEVEAAIARDDQAKAAPKGTPAPAPAPEPPKAAPKEAAKEKATLDIPEALLGAKETPAPKDTAAEDKARQKEIEENIKGLSPKAADRFRALEAKRHEAEQRAARASELEKKLEAAEKRIAAAADTSEVEQLKKQVEELDGIIQKSALSEHPKFRNHYDAQIEREVGIASKLVDKEASAEVQALLSLPETAQRNRRLNEIVGELGPIEAQKFNAAVEKADRLSADRAAELANWKVNKQRLSEMSKVEQEQTMEQRQRVADTAYKGVMSRMADPEKGVELFRKVDGNDEWNKAVEARSEHVKKLMVADMKPEDVAEMAAWAMTGAEYRKLFLSQRMLVRKLQDEVKSLRSGEPDLGQAGDVGEEPETGGMIDVLARVAQKAGAVR